MMNNFWNQRRLLLNVMQGFLKQAGEATPKTSPYGREAVNALKYYQMYYSVHKKLVYGESIAQTNQFIMSLAADVGFTARSTVYAPDLQYKGYWTEVDPRAYHPIAQGAVILKHAEKENFD